MQPPSGHPLAAPPANGRLLLPSLAAPRRPPADPRPGSTHRSPPCCALPWPCLLRRVGAARGSTTTHPRPISRRAPPLRVPAVSQRRARRPRPSQAPFLWARLGSPCRSRLSHPAGPASGPSVRDRCSGTPRNGHSPPDARRHDHPPGQRGTRPARVTGCVPSTMPTTARTPRTTPQPSGRVPHDRGAALRGPCHAQQGRRSPRGSHSRAPPTTRETDRSTTGTVGPRRRSGDGSTTEHHPACQDRTKPSLTSADTSRPSGQPPVS